MSNTHLGHRARKRFGQNFLHDEYIIDQIVSAINPSDDYNLVEIGPGLGALTEPVAEQVEHLNVVELDRDLAHRLRHHPFIRQKLNIVEADALQFDFTELVNDKPMKVFGNLPYNISTPLMFHLFNYAKDIQDMHFMLQKEVVLRLAAGPNDNNYGRLSVMAQYYCQVIPIIQVPPEAFKPAPKVDSAVVCLLPYDTPPVACHSVETLSQVTSIAFNQRRKTIRNSLSQLINSDEQWQALGIDPNLRAQNLSLQNFCDIANLIAQ